MLRVLWLFTLSHSLFLPIIRSLAWAFGGERLYSARNWDRILLGLWMICTVLSVAIQSLLMLALWGTVAFATFVSLQAVFGLTAFSNTAAWLIGLTGLFLT